ncbi:MAG TPA: sugar phosphate isomerase/epimerase family protein [Armatimonadota bacterium]|nr:sugar phosphate isomerase/epimerase family protein [Armatimonadota bacterium]
MISKLPLGISSWSLNAIAPPELFGILEGADCPPEHAEAVRAHFDEVADLILGSEIRSVELWHSQVLWDARVSEPLDRLAAAGLIFSQHAPPCDPSSPGEAVRREAVRACSSAASLLSRFGGRTLVVHAGPQANPPERIRASAASIAEIADYCADLGVSLALELLPPPNLGNSASELLELLKLIERPNVGVCIDVNHVFPPEHLLPAVHLLGPRIFTLHISDYDGTERHWLPMRGTIDWPGLVYALRQVGYPGPFMYEARFEAASLSEAISTIRGNYRVVMDAAGG